VDSAQRLIEQARSLLVEESGAEEPPPDSGEGDGTADA
jgi:hypothetical protein